MKPVRSYQFPVEHPVDIRDVLNLSFNIQPYPEAWADLNQLRKEEYRDELFFRINYTNGCGPDQIQEIFEKIIFTGHRGCGKSLELYRLAQELNGPGRFFCIYVNCEVELQLGEFEWQDFFVLIIVKLAEKIRDRSAGKYQALWEIADEWRSYQEIREQNANLFAETLGKDGNFFHEFRENPEGFKMAYSKNTQTAVHIRRVVKNNPYALALKLNSIIWELREDLRANGDYADVLFIFDGTEKVDFDKYRELFIDNYAAIAAIEAHIISAIPIATCYKLEHSAQQSHYQRVNLPMFRLNSPEEKAIFAEIITKRINKESLINDDALLLAVEKSGGCARQLIHLVSNALMLARGNKIAVEQMNKALARLGMEMSERLDAHHRNLLVTVKKGAALSPTDPSVTRLIDELFVLKYDDGSYAVNPLLDGLL